MARSSAQRQSISPSDAAPQLRATARLRLAASNPSPVAASASQTISAAAPMPVPTEAQLVARAQAGDTRAFEMLVIKHQKRVIYLASRFVGEADAPDVAQIAFVKAWRNLKGFKGESQFYTWLYRITINAAKNELNKSWRRSMKHHLDLTDAEEFGHTEQLSDFASPDSIVIADETRASIGNAIGGMTPVLKQAITLREIDGLSYDEIAEVQRVPIGTVRSRIFRARSEIDAVLQGG